MTFTLNQINAFTATYESGSYSAASRELNCSRSSVRELIIQLEDNLRLKLFSTEGNKAIPSVQGHFLYRRAKVLNRLSDAIISTTQPQEIAPEEINILYDATLPTDLIVAVERKAAQEAPTIRINWLHRNRKESISALFNNTAAFAIMPSVTPQVFPENNLLGYIALGGVPLAIFVRPQSPLAQGKVSILQLQLEKQYICENHQKASLMLSQISPDVRVVSNNDLLAEFIQHQGWGILSRSYAQPYVDAGSLVEVDLEEAINAVQQPFCLYFSIGQKSPTFQTARYWVEEYAREYWS